ncbi:MAG: hypothetical protein HY831_00690 [Candidatus Aenigmarchaeota archaeon]|nr:hypothetical protein [Candidatus Aenigmarchaeota archaeon]
MLYQIGLAFSLIAALMSVVLFYLGLKSEKKGKWYLIWAVLFLGASFGGLEWALYLLGISIFSFFIFPLIAFFAIWFGFIIWSFERIGERKIWIVFLAILIVMIIIGVYCPNCVQFS